MKGEGRKDGKVVQFLTRANGTCYGGVWVVINTCVCFLTISSPNVWLFLTTADFSVQADSSSFFFILVFNFIFSGVVCEI